MVRPVFNTSDDRILAIRKTRSSEGTIDVSDAAKREGYAELIKLDIAAVVANIQFNDKREADEGIRTPQEEGEAVFESYVFNGRPGRVTTAYEMTNMQDYHKWTILLFIPDGNCSSEPCDPEDAQLISVRIRRHDTDVTVYDPDRYESLGYADNLYVVGGIWLHLIGLADHQWRKDLLYFISNRKAYSDDTP